jgi:hypothetical protein
MATFSNPSVAKTGLQQALLLLGRFLPLVTRLHFSMAM